jgi:hypothetical protein
VKGGRNPDVHHRFKIKNIDAGIFTIGRAKQSDQCFVMYAKSEFYPLKENQGIELLINTGRCGVYFFFNFIVNIVCG